MLPRGRRAPRRHPRPAERKPRAPRCGRINVSVFGRIDGRDRAQNTITATKWADHKDIHRNVTVCAVTKHCCAHTQMCGMSVHRGHSCCCQGKQRRQPRRGGRHNRREGERRRGRSSEAAMRQARATAPPLRRAHGSAGRVRERRRRCRGQATARAAAARPPRRARATAPPLQRASGGAGASEGRSTGQGRSTRHEEGGSASGRPPCASVGGARRGARPSDEGGSDRWDEVDDGRVQRSPRAEHRHQCKRTREGGRGNVAEKPQ